MDLSDIGWDHYVKKVNFNSELEGFGVGRVIIENKTNYTVYTNNGELEGIIRGKQLQSKNLQDLPKVGDWVVFTQLPEKNKVVIERVLPRFSTISRKAADVQEEQVMAANIDLVFIVQGLDNNFNIRTLERYLVLVRKSGVEPIIILNKSDLNPEYNKLLEEVKSKSNGAKVFALSTKTGEGLEFIRKSIEIGHTVMFIGSSGVGKSSIVNSLLGYDSQKTSDVRDLDSKGRHTTTRRELKILPLGGLIIDTPGMRELGIWGEDQIDGVTFSEVDALAKDCRFSDCDHKKSKGCAILNAVKQGALEQGRYMSYLKLHNTSEFIESKDDKRIQLKRKRAEKNIHKQLYKRLSEKYSR